MSKQTNITGLVGNMRCGKDEVAKIIQYLTSDCSNPYGGKFRTYQEFREKGGGHNLRNFDHHYYSDWSIKKYADKLKDCLCLLLGCSRHDLEDPIFKEAELGEEWWYYQGEQTNKIFPYDTPY